ncbi:MAG: GTPase Era [Bacteroidales bacterium]|jgi:GTP-binding protein Era|nr:GTPase Era [Bacteroidales bacterium]
MTHKAGFVSIIGYPNVGKSTLMNALVGERLSIITPKAQTTRHRIMGLFSGDDFQIVYSDTPGVIKPHYKLHQAMMSAVYASIDDADVILLLTEPGNDFQQEDIVQKLRNSAVPVIVVINKIDLGSMSILETEVEKWKHNLEKAIILPVSALYKTNLDQVLKAIIHYLPESPAFYPKDVLTDRSQRFFVSEIIRGKILLNFSQEIPYSTEVAVESFIEEPAITHIAATIYVARETQKGIILGHQGKAIKKLGSDARKEIEAFLDKHIFLDLHVKVAKDWREDELALKRFGYSVDSSSYN